MPNKLRSTREYEWIRMSSYRVENDSQQNIDTLENPELWPAFIHKVFSGPTREKTSIAIKCPAMCSFHGDVQRYHVCHAFGWCVELCTVSRDKSIKPLSVGLGLASLKWRIASCCASSS